MPHGRLRVLSHHFGAATRMAVARPQQMSRVGSAGLAVTPSPARTRDRVDEGRECRSLREHQERDADSARDTQ